MIVPGVHGCRSARSGDNIRIDLADVDRWYREFLVGHGPVELRRAGHVVGCRATGEPKRAETDGGAKRRDRRLRNSDRNPGKSSVAHLVGNLTVHDHGLGVSHILSPDERMLQHMPNEHPC